MHLRKPILAFIVCLLLTSPCSAAWQITLSDGCVALFQDGTLLEKSTVPAAFLPERDRALLQYSLHFPCREAAAQLMEDLTG